MLQGLGDYLGGGERLMGRNIPSSTLYICLYISTSFLLPIPILLIVSKDTLNIIGIDLLSSSTLGNISAFLLLYLLPTALILTYFCSILPSLHTQYLPDLYLL